MAFAVAPVASELAAAPAIMVYVLPVGTVCISGRLKSFPSKAHAQKVLENHGFAVKTSLTKDCTYLINASGIESAKTQTARERGVIIINNLNQFIEEK